MGLDRQRADAVLAALRTTRDVDLVALRHEGELLDPRPLTAALAYLGVEDADLGA